VGVLGALTLTVVAQAAVAPQLVSRTTGGAPANGNSTAAVGTVISGDGKLIAFGSSAPNLPGGDGVTRQAYVRNMGTGTTRLVSKDDSGHRSGSFVQTNGISANGRFVTFQSTGTGLPGANGQTQVWVHDLQTGRTRIASRGNTGSPGNDQSSDSALSADGRRVAFSSRASNLPAGNGSDPRVYIRDRRTQRTILVSRAPDDSPAKGNLYGQTISSNGRRVTFYSNDPNLPGGDGTTDHVYVRDLTTGTTKLVDRNNQGQRANANSYNASISGDGRFVVFESGATNLPGQTGNQIYIRNLESGRTLLAGRNSAGQPQDGYAEFAHLSQSGRYLQFSSDADNLPGGVGVTYSLTYLRDLVTGKVRLVSKTAGGNRPDGEATQGSISSDGRWAAFDSNADNLGGDPLYQNVFRAGPLH